MATSAAVTDTSESFAVSAWVRPSLLNSTWQNAVSQDGTGTSPFGLGVASNNKWVLWLHMTDSTTGGTLVQVQSGALAVAGRWALLTGVYDLSSANITLYVNGASVGSAAVPSQLWQATGSTTIGRGKQGGVTNYIWHGDVSDAQVWDRMLYPADIAGLSPASLAGSWQLADQSGVDDVGVPPGTHPLTEVGLTDSSNAYTGGFAEFFNSATPSLATTTGPVVRTDTSFSVAAWVAPAVVSTTTTNGFMTAVSQDGLHTSGFQLQYRYNSGTGGTPTWCFTTRSADVSSNSVSPPPPTVTASCGGTPAPISTAGAGAWAYLVGVYDAGAGTITLYVNGVAMPSKPYVASWNAGHGVTVGARLDAASHTDFFDGDIDHVLTFSGALTPAQVSALYLANGVFEG
jgi:hypothetical protein